MTEQLKTCRAMIFIIAIFGVGAAWAQQTSYMPVDGTEPFEARVERLSKAKPAIEKAHKAMLEERYDLSDKPTADTKMSRGKSVQQGIRVRLPEGVKSWEELAAMKPEEIKKNRLWPKGFLPLPHPNHSDGGMVFPQFHIDEILKQEGRDLTRFDLDFDLPDHFLPEFPPASKAMVFII